MEQKKLGISLKYKLLLLLTIIPVVSLAIYIILATRLFENDKIAYVKDSSVAVAKSLAVQLRIEVKSFVEQIKPIIESYDYSGQKFSESSMSIFNKQDRLDGIILLQKNQSGVYTKLGELSKPNDFARQFLADAALLNRVERQSVKNKIIVSTLSYTDNHLLLSTVIGNLEEKNHLIAIGLYRSRDLLDAFTKRSIYEHYLIDKSGEVLLGSLTGKPEALVMQEIIKNSQPEGALDIRVNKDIIASYADAGVADFRVTALVDKKEALSAVNALFIQSFLFFIALISTTVIISVVASVKLTAALRDLYEATKLIAKGQFDIRVKPGSNDEVGGLAEGFNIMAAEVSRLMIETSEKARMASELETAKVVQETLFPADRSQFGKIRVVGHYEPASECGGDWWSYCQIGDKLYLWIGDATGHGAPAAMVTSAAKSAATIIEDMPYMTPSKALEIMNKAIHETARGKILMTFFIGCIDLKTFELTYANASHEPPYLIRAHSRGATITKKDLEPLIEANGARLGDKRSSKYTEAKVQLNENDTIILYTDGIVDLQNQSGKAWGERGFIKSICESSSTDLSADVKIEKLISKMNSYRENKELVDDITFLMCQYGGAA